jgi:hypothetical protein
MKKEKEEATASTEEITTPALVKLESSVPPWGIIELSDDESKYLITSVTANIGPSKPGPSAPWVTARPMSDDLEFTRKLFVELNQEAIGIPDDVASVDLVSVYERLWRTTPARARRRSY